MNHDRVRYGIRWGWCWWRCVAVIVGDFGFMCRNHPRFGSQISGRRNHRDPAGTVVATVSARSVVAVVRLLCLPAVITHAGVLVLGRNSAGHDTVAVTVVLLGFPAATVLLLMVQWHHMGQRLLVMVSASRDTRMMMLSVVVDPWSLWRYSRWWQARQVRQMGWRWRWVSHMLWWGWMSVHHPAVWLLLHTLRTIHTDTYTHALQNSLLLYYRLSLQ